jgi:predicted ATP-grasp superfamily ATP-dependent carboligase
MQTVTIAINNMHALQTLHELEEKKLISIIENTELDLPAVAGTPLSLVEFKNWVDNAENTPAISLEEAKSVWKAKRDQLRKLIV